MTTARDVMHAGADCIGQNDSLALAAQKMRELNVGSLPICGEDNKLHGIITDRDIVVKCVAEGRNPAEMTAEELAQGKPFWVDANADVDEVLSQMTSHHIRRMPVIENRRLIGMITEADLARNLPEDKVGRFVEAIAQAP